MEDLGAGPRGRAWSLRTVFDRLGVPPLQGFLHSKRPESGSFQKPSLKYQQPRKGPFKETPFGGLGSSPYLAV